MTKYETRLRGARNRLVDALDHAMESHERRDIEHALRLVNGLIDGLSPVHDAVIPGLSMSEAA